MLQAGNKLPSSVDSLGRGREAMVGICRGEVGAGGLRVFICDHFTGREILTCLDEGDPAQHPLANRLAGWAVISLSRGKVLRMGRQSLSLLSSPLPSPPRLDLGNLGP